MRGQDGGDRRVLIRCVIGDVRSLCSVLLTYSRFLRSVVVASFFSLSNHFRFNDRTCWESRSLGDR